jgi:hypothetical protein
MEILTIPTTPWASLPSYAPSFAGQVDSTVRVPGGGASRVFGTAGDAPAGAELGGGCVPPSDLAPRNKHISQQGHPPGFTGLEPSGLAHS